MTMKKARVAVLISGRGSNMTALINAARQPSYPAEIVLVLANRPDAVGLSHARADGITTTTIDHAEYGRDRECFERSMQQVLEEHRIEIICLAGFMRLLTPSFVRRWEERMLNIHPALLPAFKGLDTHQRALSAGVKIHGASVHFVVAEMDSGPIVAQGAVAVREDDDAETLAVRVLAIEHRIYPMALGLVAAGRVRVVGGRCVIRGGSSPRDALIVPEADVG
jgi:phosphoribosylglycinamide formyltransferase-1